MLVAWFACSIHAWCVEGFPRCYPYYAHEMQQWTQALKPVWLLPPTPCARSFDLLHVMLDETTEATDQRIADHIIRLHRFQASAFENTPYTTEDMQVGVGVWWRPCVVSSPVLRCSVPHCDA